MVRKVKEGGRFPLVPSETSPVERHAWARGLKRREVIVTKCSNVLLRHDDSRVKS
jgi:hypothetical protein